MTEHQQHLLAIHHISPRGNKTTEKVKDKLISVLLLSLLDFPLRIWIPKLLKPGITLGELPLSAKQIPKAAVSEQGRLTRH